jgi:magnesium transporter
MATPLTKANLQDLVTRHMRTDFTRIRIEQTVGEALTSLRERQGEGRIIYFYVVDNEGRLKGVMPTRRLLLNPPDKLIAEIMVERVIVIPASATVLDACEFFTLHRLLAFPVVDEDRRILGVVDVELYTDELSELDTSESERYDDLFQLIGVHLTEAQQASPWVSFSKRFPWLLCNIAGGVLAAFLAGVYEAELQKVVALALFIPVVLALAESVSIQSVSLALQTMHGQKPTWSALFLKMSRELMTGVLLGAACGVLVGAVALLWLRHGVVVLCLVGGIASGVAGAAVIGLTMPYLLRILKRDPQVAAGPIALAASDMLTLLLYFNFARSLLA